MRWRELLGSTSREVEKQAVEDRLAWLEQVINDRNMGFSLTGSAPEDDADGSAAPQDSQRSGRLPDAQIEDLAGLLAGTGCSVTLAYSSA